MFSVGKYSKKFVVLNKKQPQFYKNALFKVNLYIQQKIF